MSFGTVVLPVSLVEKEKNTVFFDKFQAVLRAHILIQLHALKRFEPFEPYLKGVFQTFQVVVYSL